MVKNKNKKFNSSAFVPRLAESQRNDAISYIIMSSSTSAPNSHAAASGSAVPKVEPGTSVTGNKADIDNNSGGEKVDSLNFSTHSRIMRIF